MSYTPMELAEVFIKTGELDDALDALNQQLLDNSTDDNARRLRASVLLRLAKSNHLQEALDDLRQLTEPVADDYVQQSIIYERMTQMNEAIQAMQSAHRLSPDGERILERLVDLLTQAKQYEDVLEILNRAPQTWRWLMRLADIHSLQENYSEALSNLNLAQTHLEEVFPDLLSPVSRNTMAQIHVARGQVQMKMDHLEAAETDYKDALYHIPDDATILFNLGLIYARLDKMTRAKRYCNKAFDNASPYIRQMLIDVLNNDSRYEKLKDRLGV